MASRATGEQTSALRFRAISETRSPANPPCQYFDSRDLASLDLKVACSASLLTPLVVIRLGPLARVLARLARSRPSPTRGRPDRPPLRVDRMIGRQARVASPAPRPGLPLLVVLISHLRNGSLPPRESAWQVRLGGHPRARPTPELAGVHATSLPASRTSRDSASGLRDKAASPLASPTGSRPSPWKIRSRSRAASCSSRVPSE